jgi:putative MFS transporter
LLGLVSLAMLFEQYDMAMLTAALKFVAEDLGMVETELGGYLSIIRLGALPAFFIVPVADRVGRRRVFLAAVLGISLSTFLTAFSQTVIQFVVLQMLARTFMITCASVALVIIAEELPAAHRGWGIGMMGALGACGNGVAALMFALVQVLPFGWRALYSIGILPLVLLPLLRREVKETGRFEKHQLTASAVRSGASAWLRPLLRFVSRYPARALGVAAAGGLGTLGSISVFQFTAYFALKAHGWQPAHFSAMVVIGGGIGIMGHVASGRLGDIIGRRRTGLMFLSAFPAFAWLFYNGPGWSLPLAWILMVFCAAAGQVIIRAMTAELFPTSQRGTAAGWLSLVETLGGAAGLGIVGLGTNEPGDIARMISWLAWAVLLSGLSLLALPETTQKELEAISAE